MSGGGGLDRRAFAGAAAGLLLGGCAAHSLGRADGNRAVGDGRALEPGRTTPGATRAVPWDDSAFNVRAMARLTSTLAAGEQGRVHYRGRAFAIEPDGRTTPLYGLEGLGSLRAAPQPSGAIRFLFAEFAVYTDLATGLPLRSWRNPLSGETVEVWHQRNGPVNYALDPAKPAFGAFRPAGEPPASGFRLPWIVDGDDASFMLDVVAERPNPLDPGRWTRESSGPRLHSSEHSQYFVRVADLADESRASVPFRAALQSLKPWHPWMLLGARPGRVYTVMTASKVAGLDALPAPVVTFARTELGPWLDAPTVWTGQYVSAYEWYARERTPAPPVRNGEMR